MSVFQQLCPSCSRLLELPANATGRLAQCPACQATFPIAPPAQGKGVDDPAPSEQTPGPASPEPTALAAGANKGIDQAAGPEAGAAASDGSPASSVPLNGPPQPTVSPFSAPLQSSFSVDAPPPPEAGIRYDRDPVARIDSLPIVPRSIEEILTVTLRIFSDRGLRLVLGILVIVIASVAASALYVNLIMLLTRIGAGGLAGLGTLVGVPLGVAIWGFVCVGTARFILAIARNLPSPVKQAIPSPAIVGRFLAGAAVLAVVGAAALLSAALTTQFVSAIGNPGLARFVSGLAAFGCIAVLLIALWLLWAWAWIVSDGREPGIRSIHVARELSRHTKLTSGLMLLVALAMTILGLAICYVGVVVTLPLVMLMFAVAYLLMTNQPVNQPRHEPSEIDGAAAPDA